MNKKKTIDAILEILALETRKIKKKKDSPVAISPLRRPMGSIFSMDAVASGVDMVSESNGEVAIKGVPRTFDHLKWKLNDYQKSFLQEFIEIPDEGLKEEDYKYASKFTGIPLTNIKSIKNTYAQKIMDSYHKPDVVKGSRFDAAHAAPNAIELGLGSASTLPKRSSRTTMMNPEPNFRGKSFKELSFNDGPTISRMQERELAGYIYEWAMYFIEGSGKFKVQESKVVENSRFGRKDKTIIVEIKSEEKLTDGFLDFASGRKMIETMELEKILEEFNSNFNTNFIIENQFTNKSGNLSFIIENNQTTDGRKIINKKTIDMTYTDEARLRFAMSQAAPPGNLTI